jgi:Uma2 family endonuclease
MKKLCWVKIKMSALRKEARENWTVDEYLAYDASQARRYAYRYGEIVAMAGASDEHNTINHNINGIFYVQLRQRPCRVYANDMRVRVSDEEYVYPDIAVVCGKPDIRDLKGDTLFNPTLIVEVLSKSTRKYDLEGKFESYRSIESLQEYVLIHQDKVRAHRYTRQSDHTWLITDFAKRDDHIELQSIACTLLLEDVYEKVSLPN